jgi:hypothetical protein
MVGVRNAFLSVGTKRSNYCFGAEPFVVRLLSFFVLSDAPGISFDTAPEVPIELPFAPELIEPVSLPICPSVGGVGWPLVEGLPVAAGVFSAAMTGADASIARTVVATKIFFMDWILSLISEEATNPQYSLFLFSCTDFF